MLNCPLRLQHRRYSSKTFHGSISRDVPECDVDECLEEDSCPENWATCTNLIGTHNCTCDDGYTFNDQGSYFNYSTWTCDDVDECDEGLDDCNDVIRSKC